MFVAELIIVFRLRSKAQDDVNGFLGGKVENGYGFIPGHPEDTS